MAASYTDEQRERLRHHITEQVHKNGHMTMSRLAEVTHASHDSIRRHLKALVSLGQVYVVSGKGVFSSELFYREWRTRPVKKTRVIRKPARKQDKGGAQPYDRRQNIICQECRDSESMQRVLAFYRGGFQEMFGEQVAQ